VQFQLTAINLGKEILTQKAVPVAVTRQWLPKRPAQIDGG